MAAHSLSIAKASLLASCLRPDPTKLNRDDLSQFHDLLETSISQCTPRNIQKTKQWLLQHILQSAARSAAFSKYLLSLSKNLHLLSSNTTQIRSCRRQLHILYVLNDIFHHVKYHARDQSLRKNVQEHVSSISPVLFAKAVEEKKSRTIKRLHDLVDIWAKEKYCDDTQITALRNALQLDKTADFSAEQTVKENKLTDTPWILPPTHGDPNAPFFDLPAANLMPHIIPNVARSIRPDQVRPLKLTAGPADESLVNAMKDFLRDVRSIDDPYGALEDEGIVADIDEMGQLTYRNEADDIVGDTYYGWSRAFCEKMKNRGKEGAGAGDHVRNARSRSRSSRSDSRSRSRSRSRSPRKRRRRYSTSRSRSPSRNRSRSRASYRDDRSSPPRRGFIPQQARGPSPPRPSDSRSYSANHRPHFHTSTHQAQQRHPAPSSIAPTFQPSPPPPQGPSPFMHGIQASVPLRPPNWQGPWPPLPPPGGLPNSQGPWPVPPPPPGYPGTGGTPDPRFPPIPPPRPHPSTDYSGRPGYGK